MRELQVPYARLVAKDEESKRVMPLQDAARESGLSRSTIHRYIRLGLLASYKTPLDRRTYVNLDELLDLKQHPPFTRVR
jgi:Helix-turn-helix domain